MPPCAQFGIAKLLGIVATGRRVTARAPYPCHTGISRDKVQAATLKWKQREMRMEDRTISNSYPPELAWALPCVREMGFIVKHGPGASGQPLHTPSMSGSFHFPLILEE